MRLPHARHVRARQARGPGPGRRRAGVVGAQGGGLADGHAHPAGAGAHLGDHDPLRHRGPLHRRPPRRGALDPRPEGGPDPHRGPPLGGQASPHLRVPGPPGRPPARRHGGGPGLPPAPGDRGGPGRLCGRRVHPPPRLRQQRRADGRKAGDQVSVPPLPLPPVHAPPQGGGHGDGDPAGHHAHRGGGVPRQVYPPPGSTARRVQRHPRRRPRACRNGRLRGDDPRRGREERGERGHLALHQQPPLWQADDRLQHARRLREHQPGRQHPRGARDGRQDDADRRGHRRHQLHGARQAHDAAGGPQQGAHHPLHLQGEAALEGGRQQRHGHRGVRRLL
mmetsp:Transcript_25339/g.64239  ORF Transcript_25339/g.64239 Transcript_25339/m.64239 type:complete len:336 (+) Transcript_25339:266-1273(+)